MVKVNKGDVVFSYITAFIKTLSINKNNTLYWNVNSHSRLVDKPNALLSSHENEISREKHTKLKSCFSEAQHKVPNKLFHLTLVINIKNLIRPAYVFKWEKFNTFFLISRRIFLKDNENGAKIKNCNTDRPVVV